MPILSNILLVAEGPSTLRLAATDLYLGVSAVTEADVKEGGSAAISARTLFDIVKNLPDNDISLKVDGNQAAEIRCGKVRYKIPGMAGDDFPGLPNPGDAKFSAISGEALGELIALTQYSMSSDDTRPHLAGALFEGEGDRVRMVTTDGHRLCKAETSFEGASKLKFSMLVPNKGITELKRLLEDSKGAKEDGGGIEICAKGGNAFFRRDGIQLSVKLADEAFPPYSKVIPQSQDRRVVLPRSTFLEALRRIALVANDKSGGVRLQIEPGMLRLTSENPDVGEGTEELDADYAGEALTIGFNARYLMDVLNALSEDEVALELGGELDPGVVKPVTDLREFVGVIMPMRI